jgi:hypothetical protein
MAAPHAPFAPLTLAKLFGVPQIEVALKLRVTPDWMRQLARDPEHAPRVRLAELGAILEWERAKVLEAGLNERTVGDMALGPQVGG